MSLNNTVQLLEKLDCLRLADQGATLRGKLALHHIETIRDMILNPGDDLFVTLAFGRDPQGFYFVSGRLEGALSVTCQRCLKPLALPVDSECLLSPITKPFEAEALPTLYEPVMLEEGRWLNTHALISEEILLNLPYVPKHGDACCEQVDLVSVQAAQVEQIGQAEQRNNPFCVLAENLKKTRETS